MRWGDGWTVGLRVGAPAMSIAGVALLIAVIAQCGLAWFLNVTLPRHLSPNGTQRTHDSYFVVGPFGFTPFGWRHLVLSGGVIVVGLGLLAGGRAGWRRADGRLASPVRPVPEEPPRRE